MTPDLNQLDDDEIFRTCLPGRWSESDKKRIIQLITLVGSRPDGWDILIDLERRGLTGPQHYHDAVRELRKPRLIQEPDKVIFLES